MPRPLSTSGELIRGFRLVFWVLGIWAFAPLVALVIYAAAHGGTLTGANGVDPFDQMQYLAWIRDSGEHFLASNLWQVGGTPHDYLQPMWTISGLLWRLGASVQLAYLVWKPVAWLVLFLGFAAYVRRMLPAGRREQLAALFLALFYASPALELAHVLGRVSLVHQYQLAVATSDALAANNLWGLEQTGLAIGLMPVFLIAVERVINRPADLEPGSVRRWTGLAALAGALVSWLHPWQGATLLGILAGLFVLVAPRRRYLALVVPTGALVAPLVYGTLLAHFDPSWRTFQADGTITGTGPWWALMVGFGPLVAVAALGVRRPRHDREWILVLWLAAAGAVYLLVPEFPPHALSGITLPLAVLAVRGWRRAQLLPRRRGLVRPLGAVGVLLALAFTVPGGVNQARGPVNSFGESFSSAYTRRLLLVGPNQAAALAYVGHAARDGAVLAPWMLSLTVPAFTGRTVYAGHGGWQPASNVAQTTMFFNGALVDRNDAVRKRILAQSRASFVIADCATPSLAATLNRLLVPAKHFGCVTVYRSSERPAYWRR